jgi:hypothetical protein
MRGLRSKGSGGAAGNNNGQSENAEDVFHSW